MSIHTALAARLYTSGEITSARAAQFAGMSLPQFLAYLSDQGSPVVDYDRSELVKELDAFKKAR